MDRQWQVSEGRSVQARGAARAEEIYYRGGQHMMAIAFHASGAEPGFGKRNQELHQASASGIGSAFRFSREQRALLMTF